MSEVFNKPRGPLSRALGFVRWFVGNVPHMLRSDTPRFVWAPYLRTVVRRPRLERYADDKRRFQDTMRGARVSHDWFSGNIPYWLAAFHRYGLFDRPVRALEIGSWEGMSSRFILDSLPRAHLTCVDTWAGADEHRGLPLRQVENNFDANLAMHEGHLTKVKSTSFEFFSAQALRAQFDLVYVDGSHYCDDVIVDAVKAFDQLKVGGILIFDDYLFRFYERPADNPAAAINAFLRLKSGDYELFMVYAQIILCKTADRRAVVEPTTTICDAPTNAPLTTQPRPSIPSVIEGRQA